MNIGTKTKNEYVIKAGNNVMNKLFISILHTALTV